MDEIKWMQEGGTVPDFVRDVSEQMGEGCLLVGGPDWVKTPSDLPEGLKNRKMRITRRGWVDIRCPIRSCRAGAPIYAMELEDDLMVSCCPTCQQYGWFMKPKEV